MTLQRDSAMIGRTLSHYQIIDQVGQVAWALSIRRGTAFGRLVASKYCLGQIAERNRKRPFIREAKAASA